MTDNRLQTRRFPSNQQAQPVVIDPGSRGLSCTTPPRAQVLLRRELGTGILDLIRPRASMI